MRGQCGAASSDSGVAPPLVFPASPTIARPAPSSHHDSVLHPPIPPTEPAPSIASPSPIPSPRQTPLHRGCAGWASPVEATVS